MNNSTTVGDFRLTFENHLDDLIGERLFPFSHGDDDGDGRLQVEVVFDLLKEERESSLFAQLYRRSRELRRRRSRRLGG